MSSPAVSPAAPGLLRGLWLSAEVVHALVLRETRTRFGGHKLGYAWALLEPILSFSYDPTWYPTTDGQGSSLVIVDPHGPLGSWGLKASWKASKVRLLLPPASDGSEMEMEFTAPARKAFTCRPLPHAFASRMFTPPSGMTPGPSESRLPSSMIVSNLRCRAISG